MKIGSRSGYWRGRAAMLGSLAVLGALASPRAACAQAIVNRVIASVDGEPITMFDLKQFSQTNGVPLPDPHDPQAPELTRAALKGLITQRMMEAELKNFADKADDEAVDKYIARLREKNGVNDEQLRQQLSQSGQSYEDFRKRARIELEKMNMLEHEVRQKISITPEQIKAYYDSHQKEFIVTKERLKLAQILVAADAKAPPGEIDAARKKAQDLRKRAAAGEDFAELAAKFSDDDSKSKGGELGDFAPDEILDQIHDAVSKLKPGEVSEVIQTSSGFHIVKLEEHDVPGPKPLADVKDEIQDKLIAASSQDRMKQWVDRDLIKSHHVESFL